MSRRLHKLLEPLTTLRRVMPLLWQAARGWAVLASLLMLLEIGFGLGMLYLLKSLVDVLTDSLGSNGRPAEPERALLFVALTAFATLGHIACRAVAGLAREMQGMRVGDFIDQQIHAKAIAADLAFYESPQYFDTLERARQSGRQRPALVVSNLLNLARNLAMLAGVVVLLATIHWMLLPLLIIAIVPALLVRIFFTRIKYEWQKKRTPLERQAGYLDWLMTSHIHAKELRLNRLGDELRARYSALRQTIRGENFRINRRRVFTELAVAVLAGLAFFAALGWLTWQTAAGVVSVGNLVLFLLIFQRSQSMGQELVIQISRFYEDHLYIGQLFAFLDVRPVIASPAVPRPLPPMDQGVLQLDDVSFTYPGTTQPVLEHIDMHIRPGQLVALVGANGSGKTSLIKLLCRLYDPSSGRIRLAGEDIRNFDLDDWRHQFSVIFQDFSRYADTVLQNIRYGDTRLDKDSPEIVSAARRAGADAFIERLPKGYDTLLSRMFEGGQELSIGEWQKLALARAFVHPSRCIILDEPTSALDPNAEFELFENFRDRIGPRSALIISHRLSTIRLADYIYVLDQGRIIEHGTHETLMSNRHLYHEAFRKQGKYYSQGAWTT